MSSNHPHLPDREAVCRWAQELYERRNFYVVDTETTGTSKRDQVVQIGIVDKTGRTVMNRLVRPTVPIQPGAQQVHGISMEMLTDAPTFADLYAELATILAGEAMIAYNATFDWRMLEQSALAFGLPMIRRVDLHCAMKQYATYRGVRHHRYNSYRWHKLTEAAHYEKIVVKDAHDALGDVRMTLQLIARMAEERETPV